MATSDPTIVLSEAPKPAVTDKGSDAGKVEASTRVWAREVSIAVRQINTMVQALRSTQPAAASVTPATTTPPTPSTAYDPLGAAQQALTEALAYADTKVEGPAGAVDGSVAVFDGPSGRKIKSAGALSFDPLGAAAAALAAAEAYADGLIAGGHNAAFGLLTATAVFTGAVIAYPGGGTIQIRFDLGNYAFIACGVATLNLSPAGSSGLVRGRNQRVIIQNTSGGIVTLTTNASWVVAGVMPATLGIGEVIELLFDVNGPAETDVGVGVIAPISIAGTVVGGDLAGTLPNPTLAVIGAATGPIGDSTHVARITIDAKGRVIGLTSVALAVQSLYPFNVKNYGATGDGSTDDTGFIQAAANDLTTAGRGTLFFPDGRYVTSDVIIIGNGTAYPGTPPLPNNANFTVAGSGRNAAVIIQHGAGKGGIYVNLTGGSPVSWNRAEVFNLGFRTANGVTAGTALELDYGVTPVVSSEYPSGSTIHSVDIGSDATGFSKGWTTGIIVQNPWKLNIYDVNGFGCSDGNVVPTSGAGSGAMIQLIGGFNVIVSNIYGSFWQQGLICNGIGGQGIQGFTSANVIFVAVREGLHIYPGAVVTSLLVSNWLVDQGNSPNAGLANVAFYIEGDPSNRFGSCTFSGCSFFQVGGVATSCGFLINDISFSSFLGCNGFASGTSGWCQITGVSTYNVFSACIYGSNGIYGSINLGASTDNNQFNNIQGAAFNNSGGGGNTSLATLF